MNSLSLFHTTKSEYLESILSSGLIPSFCDVFKKDYLYLYYGRPIYVDSTNSKTDIVKNIHLMPITFEVPWSNKILPEKIYPFDSGAFMQGFYAQHHLGGSFKELDEFLITNKSDVIELLEYFYEDSNSYIKQNRGLKCVNPKSIWNNYYQLIKDISGYGDGRSRTIEVILNTKIPPTDFKGIIINSRLKERYQKELRELSMAKEPEGLNILTYSTFEQVNTLVANGALQQVFLSEQDRSQKRYSICGFTKYVFRGAGFVEAVLEDEQEETFLMVDDGMATSIVNCDLESDSFEAVRKNKKISFKLSTTIKKLYTFRLTLKEYLIGEGQELAEAILYSIGSFQEEQGRYDEILSFCKRFNVSDDKIHKILDENIECYKTENPSLVSLKSTNYDINENRTIIYLNTGKIHSVEENIEYLRFRNKSETGSYNHSIDRCEQFKKLLD